MALLQWKDEYSVGIAAVDHEHRELIDLINQVHDTFRASGGPAVEGFFGDLFRAISAHFALEEHIMREAGYGRLREHKADHERLLDEIRDIMDETAADRIDDLSTELDTWFSHHFRVHDAPLHKALAARAP